MASPQAEAHIVAQQRLRDLIVRAVTAAWDGLPGYDEEHVSPFLAAAVPMVLAGQRQSVALTEAFLAQTLRRPPLGVPPGEIVERSRNGTSALEVYRRPFVTVWTALQAGTEWEDAVAAGLHRAQASAATDVQLAMRETLREVGSQDGVIVGYRRVPDANACAFCRVIAGQRYTTDQLMPVHPRCGCGVDVITEANRGDFTGRRENDLSVPGAAVHEHGELGPLVTDPAHQFTTETQVLG